MMKFELGFEIGPIPRERPSAPQPSPRPIASAVSSLPYTTAGNFKKALLASVICTGAALIVFGAVKVKLTGAKIIESSLKTALVRELTAGAAFYLASLFGQAHQNWSRSICASFRKP